MAADRQSDDELRAALRVHHRPLRYAGPRRRSPQLQRSRIRSAGRHARDRYVQEPVEARFRPAAGRCLEAIRQSEDVDQGGDGFVLSSAHHVGSRGYNLPFYSDPNAVPVQFNAADGHWRVVPGAGLPFPSWGRIRTRTNIARSWYNGMTASVNRRFANGLLFQGSYTYGNSR